MPGDPKPISDDKPRVKPDRWKSRVTCSTANKGPVSTQRRDLVRPAPLLRKARGEATPKSDPSWEGHTTGACTTLIPGRRQRYLSFWLATAPGAAPPPDPRVLAQQAIQSMQLHAIEIGIVPEPRPDRIGVIGLPTWMWADSPDQHTWGPITRTASAGGYTVTATGRVQRVVWAMGDGSTVVCTKRGTPYADSFGKRSSPDCGHRYTRQGRYTVRATSYWVVEWAGIGQSGTIPMNFTSTAVITMGEVQVLSR